jgi:hypothetical protein
MYACYCFGYRDRIEPREHVFDKRLPARTRSATRTMHAVQKLAHRYDADRALFRTEELVERV